MPPRIPLPILLAYVPEAILVTVSVLAASTVWTAWAGIAP